MKQTEQLAKHLREVFFGGNWTDSSLKQHLEDVSQQEAVTEVADLNTMAALVYHINYYIRAVLKVLAGGPLDASDRFSFDLPPIRSEADWKKLLDAFWKEAEDLASQIEALPEATLSSTFVEEKYGSYNRNLQGIIEHTHYHLGQIVLIKRLIRTGATES